jgi:TldD protein
MTDPATLSLTDRAGLDRASLKRIIGEGLAGADDGELFL